jgi:flagellar protein FlbT
MALKISLKPGEKFVVNGAVITNGDRRASLIIQNRVSILREKDILQEEEANTPVRRIYFPIMLMYLENETGARYYDEFVERMSEFMGALENPEVKTTCLAISRDVMTGNYYRALMTCKKLFEYEKERLQYVPDGVYEGATYHGHAS